MKTNEQIRGDLSVCCAATVAGRLTAAHNALVKGNLRVEGWLDAKNLRLPCKGLFADAGSLVRSFPHPMPGWWALVGQGLPAEIYIAVGGRWEDSGATGGDINVDLDAYDALIEAVNDRVNDLEAEMLNPEHPVEVRDTAAADLVIADEHLNPIATFADGHIRTAKFNSATALTSQHPVAVQDTSAADLVIADDKGNALLSVVNGHILTSAFNSANISVSGPAASGSSILSLPGKWCALGTSITYWDSHRDQGVKGYQYWVRKRVGFAGGYVNKGVNSAKITTLASNLGWIVQADYYTLEFGTNDFLGNLPLGTMDNYVAATNPSSFYGAMRLVIEKIYEVNPSAMIIMCTPRKCRYADFGVPQWDSPNGAGDRLTAYVDAVRQIAEYESLPVADFFALTNANRHNLAALSVDDALHPNTLGHQMMANVLIRQFYLLQNLKS